MYEKNNFIIFFNIFIHFHPLWWYVSVRFFFWLLSLQSHFFTRRVHVSILFYKKKFAFFASSNIFFLFSLAHKHRIYMSMLWRKFVLTIFFVANPRTASACRSLFSLCSLVRFNFITFSFHMCKAVMLDVVAQIV